MPRGVFLLKTSSLTTLKGHPELVSGSLLSFYVVTLSLSKGLVIARAPKQSAVACYADFNQRLSMFILFFFACPKKNQKKTSENGYTAFSDLSFNLAFVLLW